MAKTKCTRCGKEFACGHPGTCWCSALPQIMPLDSATTCYCRECLIEKQQEYLEKFFKKHTLEQSLTLASDFKNNPPIEGLDYTIEKGNWVFSKWYHLKRGFCCNSGCRHCPY